MKNIRSHCASSQFCEEYLLLWYPRKERETQTSRTKIEPDSGNEPEQGADALILKYPEVGFVTGHNPVNVKIKWSR